MSFFDSEIVQKEMEDITSLQEEIYDNVYSYFTMNKKEKIEHIKLLQTLVDKQKILYARLSLSDDPRAKQMKENIRDSAKNLGFPDDADLNKMFASMSNMITLMMEALEEQE
tara:strand:- start:449 stop:784 length:336 start_codon:yes stop_codon:yes gene_type:complete